MKPVLAAIYARLGSATGAGSFHALLGGRYFHMEAPQNTAFPLCTYRLMDVASDPRFGGSKINRGILQFSIFAEARLGADAASDIEEALFDLLDQQTLTVTGGTYGNVTLQCLGRGVPYATEEFIILNTTYSIFSTRT